MVNICSKRSSDILFSIYHVVQIRGRFLNSVPTGILVKMLKKEKTRAQDAAAQLANITNNQSLTSQSALKVSPQPLLKDECTTPISAGHEGRAIQYMKTGTLRHLILFCFTTYNSAIFTTIVNLRLKIFLSKVYQFK